MATLKTDKIDKSLRKKGFVKEEKDHHYYFYYHNGKKTAINTRTSHGKTEIGDTLIGLMAKQLFLEKEQFMRLVQCTLDAESYKKILINKEKIM